MIINNYTLYPWGMLTGTCSMGPTFSDSRLHYHLICEVTPTEHCVYELRSVGAFVFVQR